MRNRTTLVEVRAFVHRAGDTAKADPGRKADWKPGEIRTTLQRREGLRSMYCRGWSQSLTSEEFASLITVGNTLVNSAAPVIPAAHSARLIALGYMVEHAGRLRMTTAGRVRIYAGQRADSGAV